MEKRKSIPLSIQVLYGIGVSYAIVDQIFAQWVLYFYLPPSDSGLQPIMAPIFISLALVISRFVDMIADPLIGYWSDQTQTKWGRRIPFIAFGAIPLALTTVAFFYPVHTGGNLGPFIYLSTVGCLFFIFYTVVGAPYNALIPEIASSKTDRLNLATWQSVFRLVYTAIAMILPGVLIRVLGGGDTQAGIRYMVMVLSVLAVIGMMTTVFTVDERKYSGSKKSDTNLLDSLKSIGSNRNFWVYLFGFMFFFLGFNILRASMNYYIEDIMGYGKVHITIASALLFGGAALFFYPVNRLSKKVGYRKPMLISLFLLVVFSLMLFQIGKLIPVSYGFPLFFLMGIPISGAAFIFPPAMLSEISAYNSEKKGENLEGIFFGVQGFFLKMAFLFSIAILPILLVWGGDVPLLESMVRSPEGVQERGVYATSIAAAIAFALSFVCYYFYQEELTED